MRRFSSLFITSLGTLFATQSLYAAAFQFYELGTPIVGTADVGQAAVANDASTAYFNPAGMTQFKDSQFQLGSQLVLPYTNFSQSSRTTISGDNGGDAGTLTPGVDVFYIYSYMPKLKFGVSLTSPYGGFLTYNNGWVGRFVVQNLQLFTLNLNPVVAYRVNDWLSIGGGIAIEYANLHEDVALPLTRLIDGQANIKVDNTSAGFNLGVLLTPKPSTKIGVAYRSRINHHLTGDTTFLRIGATPSTSTSMVMPNNVILSLSQQLSNRFTFLGELGWSNWSTMKNTVVHIAGFSATTPRNWRNTYRFGLAGQYQATPSFLFQAGASYDSSPTVSSKRLPDLPMDRQIRLGAGIIYGLIKAVNLGVSYEYINFGNANINNVSSNGALVGSYSRNYANVFQASLNIDC